MLNGNDETRTRISVSKGTDSIAHKQAEEVLLKAGALQNAIFNSANFSSIATDAKGVIQIFNVGAERMLGYTAAEVMNKITPGFEALVFKASRGIEDIYELTYIRKDGSRFPAVVSSMRKSELLKIALCSAPALSSASSACLRAMLSVPMSR